MGHQFSYTMNDFSREYCELRRIMGNRQYTQEHVGRALAALSFVLLNLKMDTPAKEMTRCREAYSALIKENARRCAHRLFAGIK